MIGKCEAWYCCVQIKFKEAFEVTLDRVAVLEC